MADVVPARISAYSVGHGGPTLLLHRTGEDAHDRRYPHRGSIGDALINERVACRDEGTLCDAVKCTHVALQVRDIDKSIGFYQRYCGLQVVHHRTDADVRVAWLGWGEDPPRFVIVLIGQNYETNIQPPVQHLGMAVNCRDEVDALYRRALADGLTNLWPPVDAGPVVGYYCGVADPDGNMVEFSHGQRIG